MAALQHSEYWKNVILNDTKLKMSKIRNAMRANRCLARNQQKINDESSAESVDQHTQDDVSEKIAATEPPDEHKEPEMEADSNEDLIQQFEGHMLIDDFLWIGGQDSAVDVMGMQALGIDHVLNCAGGQIKFKYSLFGMDKYSINALDSDDYNIAQHIAECIEFISKAKKEGGKVLVHCVAGRNRSAAICCAYLIFTGMSIVESYELILTRRKLPGSGLALENKSFQEQLIEFAYGMDRTGSEFAKYLRKKDKDKTAENMIDENVNEPVAEDTPPSGHEHEYNDDDANKDHDKEPNNEVEVE